MGQWIIRRTNVFSATVGMLVPPNPDRISVFITNLGPSLCHISPEPGDAGTTQGLAAVVNNNIELRWNTHGELARGIFYCVDPAAAQNFFILECLYYPGEGEDSG